jgi:lipoprotein-anchoring transpeptidase ErfK/SrfK
MKRLGALACAAAIAASLVPTSARTARSGSVSDAWPRAGTLVAGSVAVRVSPDPNARVVSVLRQFRSDFRQQIVLAVRETVGADGRRWDKLSLPMRPNGTFGWVPAASITVTPRVTRIVVRRGERRLRVYRGSRVLFSTPVAVGSKGRETPLGSFYVTARFVPDDSFLGTFALETSAYSKLTEWPGGGVVGIHGTSQPWLLGRAVSHGCVRVSNDAARALERLVPLGTPISIVR